jgi:apolipoprotein N-acyltransferase
LSSKKIIQFSVYFWLSFISSFLLVAFGQPSRVPLFGIFAGAIGFALFWRASLELSKARDRFLLSVIWFALVHAVQLSWMTTIEYMGPFILVVYALLAFGMGIQFGFLSLSLTPGTPISWQRAFSIAGCWTLFEWMRIFLLSGYPWNPVGLALSCSIYSLQLVSVLGVYGLSFWVILSNLFALNLFYRRNWICFLIFALFPYLFGFLYIQSVERWVPNEKKIEVALVQTSLLPDEKEFDEKNRSRFIPPIEQWEALLLALDDTKKVDLIVFPEAAVPFGAFRCYCPLEYVKRLWKARFGTDSFSDFPELKGGVATNKKGEWLVANAFIAQAIANHYQAGVVIGLDDQEQGAHYNAAFHFFPNRVHAERCEKRVLVPVGEYVPLSDWKFISKFLAREFGIHSSFSRGTAVKTFQGGKSLLGVSICAEEVFSELIRQLRLNGAELFVNISNDAWFPLSSLPEQHFAHGRLRAVENGVPAARSCNRGVSAGVDCFGRILGRLETSNDGVKTLYLSVPLRAIRTPYTYWGDALAIGVSFISLLFLVPKILFRSAPSESVC